jgi:hypothetical protein
MPQDPQDPSIPAASGTQLGGAPNSLRGFIQSMVNIHTSRENAATSELNKMLTAAHAGFPVDPNAVTKTAKKAGIPLMKPQDMHGLLNPPPEAGQPAGGSQSQTPAAPKKNELGDTINDPHAAAYNVKAITDVKQRQKVETNHSIDGMIRQAVTNHQLQGANEQQTLEYTHSLMQKKQAALNGDPRALGQLAASGNVSIDVPTNVWMAYNPKQREQYLEMTRGAESDASKAARVQSAATHLVDQGAFDTPEAAYQAAASLADGKGVPAELKSHMRPTSLVDLTKQVDVAGKMADIGLSGSQLWEAAQGANLTGIANYFPKNFTTIQQQMMAQKNKGLSIEQQRVGVEGENARTSRMQVTGYDKDGKHISGSLENQQTEYQARLLSAQNTAARIDHALTVTKNTELRDEFTALVNLSRSKNKVDPELMNFMETRLVKAAGGSVTPTEVKSWFGFVTTPGIQINPPDDSSTQGSAAEKVLSPDNDNTDPAAAAAGAPQ